MLTTLTQHIFASVFSLGALQALLLTVLLHRRGGWRSPAGRRLMLLLSAIAAVLVHHAYYAAMPPQIVWRYAFNGLAAAAWFAVPALYLAYVRTVAGGSNAGSGPANRYLLLPAAYHLFTWFPDVLGYGIPWYRWLGEYYFLHLFVWVGGYSVFGLYCGALALRELRRPANPQIRWLRQWTVAFLVALTITLLVLLALAVLSRYSAVYEFALLTVFAAFALGVGYQTMARSAHTSRLADRRYGDNAKPPTDLNALHQRLTNHLRDHQPYLNPDLRRSDLAAALRASEAELGQVFTRHLDSSFYAVINDYRLRHFEQRLLDGSLEELTLEALARECGFRSKTPLYRIFREKHGATPGAWVKERAVAR